jgi:hypothetical protein
MKLTRFPMVVNMVRTVPTLPGVHAAGWILIAAGAAPEPQRPQKEE